MTAPTSSFTGTTALITGASRGIGAAIARQLASAGCQVALVARNAGALRAIAAEIGTTATALPCDVADAPSVAAMTASVLDLFDGAPDILINNAGLFQIAPLSVMSTSIFTDTIHTNLVAPFLILRALLPSMHARGSGHVVTIGSVADRTVFPENGAYSPSKYGLRALHEVLRTETRGTGVRATLISPGSVDTDMWEPLLSESPTHVARQLPTRDVMLAPNDVADAVLYALSRPPAVNIDELRLTYR